MAPGVADPGVSTVKASALEDLLPNDEDLLYEEELLRNPFSLKMWWRYIEARKHVSARRKYLLYERALKSLPGSYKVSTSAHSAFHNTLISCSALYEGKLVGKTKFCNLAISPPAFVKGASSILTC